MATEYDPTADYYAILSIDVSTTVEGIKKAHRARISEIHPGRGGDSTRATAVNVARDVLSEPHTRREYDQARRDWLVKALQDPLLRAFFAPEAQLAADQAARTRTQGSVGGAPPGVAPAATDASTAPAQRSSTPPASNPDAPPYTRQEIKAAAARLSARLAAERVGATWQASVGNSRHRMGATTATPSHPHVASGEQARRWEWGVVSEYAWDDVCKVFGSGDWLGAVGLLGTALFVDRAIHESADAAQLAALDVAVAAKQRERAMAFIETVAGALGAHFGLDRTDVAIRAGAAARKAASTTARASAASRQGKARNNGAPRAGVPRRGARRASRSRM
jgi:hypothetical protein